MRDFTVRQNTPTDKLEREVEDKAYRKASIGRRESTSELLPTSTSSSSSPSLSSQLSINAISYEKLSVHYSSDTEQESNLGTPPQIGSCNDLSRSSLDESSASVPWQSTSPCQSDASLAIGNDGINMTNRTSFNSTIDEVPLENFHDDQPDKASNEKMDHHSTVENVVAELASNTLRMPSSVLASPQPCKTSPVRSITLRPVPRKPSLAPAKTLPKSSSSSGHSRAPWMLLLWCHLSQILAGGLLKSLAVFLDDILEEFDSSVAFMGWMFSLEAFFFGLTCPFASFGTKRLGPRAVMMVGGFINGVGILIASLATNIVIVGVGISAIAGFHGLGHLILYGNPILRLPYRKVSFINLLLGTGSSMIYVAALVTVRRNFHTFYAVANGITLAGVSVALFTFPPIIRVLINHYGWRNALFILSAISLNAIVTGALMNHGGSRQKPRRSSSDKGEIKPFLSSTEASRRTESTKEVSCTLRKNCAQKLNGSNTGVRFNNIDERSDCEYENRVSKCNDYEVDLRSVYIDGSITTIPVNSNGQPYRRPSLTEKYVSLIVENITHVLLCMLVFLWSMANTSTMKYLVAAGVQRGLTSIQGAMLLSSTGIAQCLSLLVNGIIVSKGWITPLQLYLVVFLVMASAGFGLAMFQHYVVGLVCSALFGLGSGTIVSLNLVVQRTLDHRAGAQAAGWLMFIEGVAGCIGGFCIGAVRDLSGSYTVSFFVSSAMTSIAAALVVVILVIRRVRRGH